MGVKESRRYTVSTGTRRRTGRLRVGHGRHGGTGDRRVGVQTGRPEIGSGGVDGWNKETSLERCRRDRGTDGD